MAEPEQDPNFLLDEELRKLKEQFREEKACVEDELCSEPSFEEIVGRSAALQRVLRQVEVVAPTDSGVLIQGETGTGKELIARAIHNRSARRDRPSYKKECQEKTLRRWPDGGTVLGIQPRRSLSPQVLTVLSRC